MARNGSGAYSLPAGNPVVTGTTISSTVQNNTMTDIGTALTQSLAYDGQTNPVANLPMAGFRHTGVANAAARTDYAAAGQVQDSSLMWAGTAGGTANALTLTLSPAITAIAAGQRFAFKSGASPNSAATTVAISGLATIAVQVNGAACVGGEILANNWYEVLVDASLTSCQLNKIGQATSLVLTGLLTTNGQIKFPATQNPSADANTLDDYEEGTWTPVVTAQSGTFTTVSATGSYTKIGRAVHMTVTINITAMGTAAGNLNFTPPFTASSIGNGSGRDTTTGFQLQALLSGTTCSVYPYNNGFPGGNGSSLQISVTYFTA